MSPLAGVICTVDRAGHLARLLPAVLAQLPAGAEVVVVDQSGDEEHARIRAVVPPEVCLIRLDRRSLPAARNVGIAATRAPIVLFLDDDVVPFPGCLAGHLAAYRDPTVGGVVGRIVERRLRPNSRRVRNDIGWDGRIRVRLDGDTDGPIGSLKGANLSARRRALEEVGGFDEGWGGTALLEDADLSERLARRGWRLWFAAGAGVEHFHAETGGVRVGSPEATERWRFRNTARFLVRHRGRGAAVHATPTRIVVAAARAVRWRRPAAVPELLGAWVRGLGAP